MSSMGLHAAREELGLPNLGAGHMGYMPPSSGPMHSSDGIGGLPKPISLSPRTFGMEDLRDFCAPLGSFKTGLTPRFTTGLTPRSGFTPRFTTGFTPRISVTGLPDPVSTSTAPGSYMRSGYSPRADVNQKISPSGFTPKDVSGVKVPMRFPGAFAANSPPEAYKHASMHHDQQQHHHHHQQQLADMAAMNMPLSYDYMSRPVIPPPMDPSVGRASNATPNSDRVSDQEDLDERRRMKNRERVRKCRKRKQDRLNFLEDRTAELEKENGVLRAKMARVSSTSAAAEPMSEAQLNELRKKQNTTLAAYVRAYNEAEGGAFESGAGNIWTENAEISLAGDRVAGIHAILDSKRRSSAVFSSYKLRRYDVQWKPSAPAHDKCDVTFDVDVVLSKSAASDKSSVPLAAPFGELAAHLGEGEQLSFRIVSHVTFSADGKIAEEIRQLDLAQVAQLALERLADSPLKAAAALRVLVARA